MTPLSEYQDSCYYAPTPRITPDEARDICHGYGTELVCNVASNAELIFIGKLTQVRLTLILES